MNLRSSVPLVFFIINTFKSVNEVEAGVHELVPLRGGWFGSVDNGQQIEEVPTPEAFKERYAEFPYEKRRKLKTKEKSRKKTFENVNNTQDHTKKKNKKKRKRKKKPVRFLKTTVSETDKESNMTDSMEVTKRSKPVDIIVHIKMSE